MSSDAEARDVADLVVLASISLPEWELHGLATGVVIGLVEGDDERASQLVDTLRPELCQLDPLTQLCQKLRTSLAQSDLTFELVLPDDDESLMSRAEALGIWVGALVEGFEKAAPPRNDDIDEILTDFVKIAEIDSNVQNTPDMELSLMEIIEFVRIATISLSDEIKRAPTE